MYLPSGLSGLRLARRLFSTALPCFNEMTLPSCAPWHRLDEDAAAGRHGNCAEVLAAIARSRASPLTSQLCEPQRLEGLMRRAIVAPPAMPSVQVSAHSLPRVPGEDHSSGESMLRIL